MKKIENKSISDSSCSDSYKHNLSNKKDWKHGVTLDDELFFIKRSKKSQISGGVGHMNNSSPNSNKIKNPSAKLSTIKNADINKELHLIVSSKDRYRFGRRSSIIESMLGFAVIPFCDNVDCLMISNIIDKSLKTEHPYIQEGDWFKTMDNVEVRTSNIDRLLLQYSRSTKVRLTFKSANAPQKESMEDSLIIGDICSFGEFAYNLKQLFENKSSADNLDDVFLTLIIHQEYFQGKNNDFLFYYPFLSNNFLYAAKGSFLTLDSLLTNDFKSSAMQSIIKVNNNKYYVSYGHLNDMLVVCAFSSKYQNKEQAKSNCEDFIKFLKFKTLDYKHFQFQSDLNHVCDVFKNNIIRQSIDSGSNFFSGSSLSISLPKEAQLRINDALSEFESMDHKKWNETHKTSSDLIVNGTALYYRKFLLSSNLSVDLRLAIECFIRVKSLTSIPNLKEMYIWEGINNRAENNANKSYLAICVRKDLMLVTVLKSPLHQGENSSISCIPYMEEIANTVDYLLSTGIDFISQVWIDIPKRPSLKKINQSSAERKFTIQKDISLDLAEGENSPCQEFQIQNLLINNQLEDETRKNLDLENISDDFGDFKEYNKDYESFGSLLNEVKNIMPMNWTAGWSNSFKYFLHWNYVDSVITCPSKSICLQMHLKVIKESILNIHNLIHNHSNYRSKKTTDSSNATIHRNFFLKEHGVSINLKSNDQEKSETIFIIGRLFALPLREVYVCFGPNYSQNLVELAFRMSLLNVG